MYNNRGGTWRVSDNWFLRPSTIRRQPPEMASDRRRRPEMTSDRRRPRGSAAAAYDDVTAESDRHSSSSDRSSGGGDRSPPSRGSIQVAEVH